MTLADAETPKRARIILNPLAGHAEDISAVQRARALWEARDWQVDWFTTEYAGHATALARDAQG